MMSHGMAGRGHRAPPAAAASVPPKPTQADRAPFSELILLSPIIRSLRCRKDLIEEELFRRNRDLFSELELVFFDTTSLCFQGQGGPGTVRGTAGITDPT